MVCKPRGTWSIILKKKTLAKSVQWLLLTYYLLEWRQVNSFLLNSTKGFGTLKENNKNPFFLFCNKGRQRLSYWVRSFYIAVFVLFINFILLDREAKYYSSVYEQEINSNSSSFVDQTCRHDIQLVILPVIQSPKIKQKILLKVYTFFGRSDHSLEGLIILWKVWSWTYDNRDNCDNLKILLLSDEKSHFPFQQC